jgi:hypothetical protein
MMKKKPKKREISPLSKWLIEIYKGDALMKQTELTKVNGKFRPIQY